MEFQLTDLIDGQYKVVEKHRGGMSIVYIVLDEFSQKRFAIKTVKEELLDDRSAVSRFCEEAKTWMNIGRHQHVVEAIIYRDIEGQPFLWLEYVAGSDLKRLAEAEKTMFAPQLVQYALQVCEAMSYVHAAEVRGQKGVIHRDLKPANIMVEPRMGAKITDFGLAKVYGHARDLTDVGVGLGTYLYMPPEQFLDAGSADATSDVFSFGASMYAGLTGKAPVSGETVGAVINSILSKIPPSPTQLNTDVPPPLAEVVMRCIAKSRGDRYPSFDALSEALLAAQPAMHQALADLEVYKCQGCGHTARHQYRVCPICKKQFDLVLFGDLAAQQAERFARVPAIAAQPSPPEAEAPVDAPPDPEPKDEDIETSALYAQAVQQRQQGRLRQAQALLRDVLTRDSQHNEARAALDEISLELARQTTRAPKTAYNWPMFRGNVTRSGFTPEVILPPLRKRWQEHVGEWIISSPAIVNGIVYAGAYVDRPGRNGRLVALSARDGAIVWSVDLPHEVVSSPLAMGGRTVYAGYQSSLVALDCKTGQRLWEYTTAGEVVGGPAGWKRTLFFGSCDGRLYAVHALSGQQIWAFRTRGEIVSSPAYWDGTVYVGSSDNRMYAVSATNGRVKWEFTAAGEIVSTPVHAAERVYFGSTDNRVYCLDAPSGDKLWEYQTEGQVHSSPAVAADNLYVGSRDHHIYCLDARTGAMKWRIATGDWVHSSPLVSGSVVYCGSHDGRLYAIDTETETLIWEYETGAEIQSSPAASAGQLYVGSNDGNIYCFRTNG